MFCPKCGRRNDGDYKFCRGCGENLQAISKAMERRWMKLWHRALDGYIRSQNRKLPAAATYFRRFWWFWLMFIGSFAVSGVFGGYKNSWVIISFLLLGLLANFWDYVSFRRFSSSGSNDKKSSAQPAAELSSTPTTNELPIPTTNELAPPFSVAETTTRRLQPLAAEKRSGDLL